MKALVLGATGAVGKDLIAQLINDHQFSEIHLFVRRNVPEFSHEKIHIHVVDFNRPEEWQHLVQGDVAFSCMGTNRKAAGSKAAQYQVDYTYQYQFAKAAAEHHVSAYILVSAAMADAQSPFFYTRMKGELEDAVRKLPFAQITLLRPPLLIRKGSTKLDERIFVPLLRTLSRCSLFRSQRPMLTEVVARCMVACAKKGRPGVLKAQDIWQEQG